MSDRLTLGGTLAYVGLVALTVRFIFDRGREMPDFHRSWQCLGLTLSVNVGIRIVPLTCALDAWLCCCFALAASVEVSTGLGWGYYSA